MCVYYSCFMIHISSVCEEEAADGTQDSMTVGFSIWFLYISSTRLFFYINRRIRIIYMMCRSYNFLFFCKLLMPMMPYTPIRFLA